jgi:hypothetical protein
LDEYENKTEFKHQNDTLSEFEDWMIESTSSPLVGFGGLNDNIIKGLISLLSVEQKIEYVAYT